jgi:hypothetical protein
MKCHLHSLDLRQSERAEIPAGKRGSGSPARGSGRRWTRSWALPPPPISTAQRCVGIERLIEDSDAAAVGVAARAEAVDGKRHVSPGTQPIGDPGEMPGNANTAVQYDNRRERSAAVEGLPSSAAKPVSGRAR